MPTRIAAGRDHQSLSRLRADVAESGPGADVAESGPGADVAESGPGADVAESGPGADVAGKRDQLTQCGSAGR